MRIAVLTDVHGNLPALEAALSAIDAAGCTAIYHTGDAVGIGPFPAECVARLLAVDARCVLGNHECYLLDLLPHDEASGMSVDEVAHHAWVRSSLSPSLCAAVSHWPWLIEETIYSQRLAFLHYAFGSPKRDYADLVRPPSVESFDTLFAPYGNLIFFGHQHSASDVQGRGRYVNPGSLGCSPDPVARFAILDLREGCSTLTKHAIPYDDTLLLRAFDERQVPDRVFIRRAFFNR